MRVFYLVIIFAGTMLLGSCTKQLPDTGTIDVNEWMQTHEKGIVAYVDYYTGNYIVETARGYSVIQSWSGVAPREYDIQYAYFGNWGLQTIYSRTGNYFTQGKVVDSWLSWYDAYYLLQQISNSF